LIGQDVGVLPRKIIGIDIYKGLNNLKNLHIVLGGRAIASANYVKNVVTKNIFDIFSGFITGLVEAGNSGITSLNGSYGAVYLDGVSGVKISDNGYPDQTITIEYTSGNFTNVDLAPQSEDLPHKEGRLYYSSDTKTVNAQLDIPDVTLNIGQEEYIRTVNKTSSTIFNGTPVYISGAFGNRPMVWPALATNKYHIEHLVGVATHNIENNQEGLITTNGIVNGVHTNAFNAGDILYLATSGGLTNSIPNPTGAYGYKIGYSLTSQNNGKILVKLGEQPIGPYKDSYISLSLTGFVAASGGSATVSSQNQATGIIEIMAPYDFVATGLIATCSISSGAWAGIANSSRRVSGCVYQRSHFDQMPIRQFIGQWAITGELLYSTSNELSLTSPSTFIPAGNLIGIDVSGVPNRFRGITVSLLGKS
jgi:hypothetical protein